MIPPKEKKQEYAPKRNIALDFCAWIFTLSALAGLFGLLQRVLNIKGFDLKKIDQSIPLVVTLAYFILVACFIFIAIGLFQRRRWLRSFFRVSMIFVFLSIFINVWFVGVQIIDKAFIITMIIYIVIGVLIEINKREFMEDSQKPNIFLSLFRRSLKGMIFLQIIAIPAFYIHILASQGIDYMKDLNYADLGYYQTSIDIQDEVLDKALDLGTIDIRLPDDMQLYSASISPYIYNDLNNLEIRTKNLCSYMFVDKDTDQGMPKYFIAIDNVGIVETIFGVIASFYRMESAYDFEYKLNIPGFTGFFTLAKSTWLKSTCPYKEIASSANWKGFIYIGETDNPRMKVFKANIYSLDGKRSIWISFIYDSLRVPEDLAYTVFESMVSSIEFNERLSYDEYLATGKELMLNGHYQSSAINCINAFDVNSRNSEAAYCAALALYKYYEKVFQPKVLEGAALFISDALALSPDWGAAIELKEKIKAARKLRNATSILFN